MPIRRPQISFRPWVRGRDASIAVGSASQADPTLVEPVDPAPGKAGEAGSNLGAPPPARKRGPARSAAAGSKAPRAVKTRLQPTPEENDNALPARSAAIRVVLVEDISEMAAHIRELFRPRPQIKLLEVLVDSRHAIERIRDLDVDVVIVDTLLQGRVKGPTLIDRIRKADLPVGIVAITVPDQPLNDRRAAAVDAVITMPFGTFDLARGVADARGAASARNPMANSRTVAVFASKGGVGTTTIAYNLAASLQVAGLKTILVDGSLQFGDLRRLLRIPADAPSILDLPTDAVRQSDIADVVFSDTSGIDVLPAPVRPEMAELMTDRDLAAVFDLLRRTYQAVVIDTPSSLDGATLAMLDASDIVLQVVTPDPATIETARVAYQTFGEIGYAPGKLRYLVNRVGSSGGLGPDRLARALGRDPDFTIRSDWQLVAGSSAEGIPFVIARPEAPASADIRALAAQVAAIGSLPPVPVPGRARAHKASLVEARRH